MEPSGGGALRVVVAGVGSFTQRVILPGLLATPGVDVAGVFGPTAAKVDAVAARLGIAGAYSDYERMLDVARPDAVVVATPNDLHAPMAHAAIARGLHVLCEKPLGVTLAEAASMADAARRAAVRTAVNFTYRSTSPFRHLRALVREGRIGRLHHMGIAFHQGVRADPAVPVAFRMLRERGGGALMDVGIHMADALRWLAGDADHVAGTTQVVVPMRPSVPGGPPDARVTADDVASFVVRFPGGASGTVQVSQVTHGRAGFRRIDLAGDAGTVVFEEDRHEPPVVRYTAAPSGRLEVVPTPQHLDVPFDDFPRTHVGRMVRALRGQPPAPGDDPWPDFDDGVAAQRLVDAVERSAAGAGWVRVAGGRD